MNAEELNVWTRLNECECVKKVRIDILVGDVLYNKDYDRMEQVSSDAEASLQQHKTWIPTLYDPMMPERSLIGIYRKMRYDYYKNLIRRDNESREPSLYWIEDDLRYIFNQMDVLIDRPDLALAKAIIEQEKSNG